ncbi:biliverdin-producing heme oxygenase [Telmatocola sphagniphila]|uniref:Biliverdin-producing heme oxygenase n=1 Tax=Telmatocola sphagniphila TaxID=1123043 RepID=A0A8E6B8D8_9BACT|nr:biliverdin-producing heme oxygenase [Telmatocola sphagniphila]QVL33762.1 biliverdin-producing heme oxygenase [Telmatocola sphagniphila]
MSLLHRARTASGDLHRRIENTPLAQQLARGTVERDTYLRLLEVLLPIHTAVEAQLAHPPLNVLTNPNLPRRSLLIADRAALAAPAEPFESEHLSAWQEALQEEEAVSPWVWAGALYVLEGSRMGSRMLAKTVAAALQLPLQPGLGLDYHLAGLSDGGQTWQEFKAFLENAPVTASESDSFARGVGRTFQVMFDVYEELSGATAARS